MAFELSNEGWDTLDDLIDLARDSWEDYTRLNALEAELDRLRSTSPATEPTP